MTDFDALLKDTRRKLLKALDHLDYSYRKVLQLPEDARQLDEESLETWESFSARFSRVADIFMSRYLKTLVLKNDPGFSGSLRDVVNQGEKLLALDDAKAWMAVRELRNISAHDYSEEDLTEFFKRLKKEAPRLLKIRDQLK